MNLIGLWVQVRSIHSPTSQLNLSRVCHCNHPTYPPKLAHVKPKWTSVSPWFKWTNRPISVYLLGERPIQSCGQGVSAPRGKAGARLNAHTELRTKGQRSAQEAIYRDRPIAHLLLLVDGVLVVLLLLLLHRQNVGRDCCI